MNLIIFLFEPRDTLPTFSLQIFLVFFNPKFDMAQLTSTLDNNTIRKLPGPQGRKTTLSIE